MVGTGEFDILDSNHGHTRQGVQSRTFSDAATDGRGLRRFADTGADATFADMIRVMLRVQP